MGSGGWSGSEPGSSRREKERNPPRRRLTHEDRRLVGAGCMCPPFILGRHPSADRRASFGRPRVKTGHLTLGATRSRLIQVVRHLGIYRERIADRLREEERSTRLDEEKGLRELRPEHRGPASPGEA